MPVYNTRILHKGNVHHVTISTQFIKLGDEAPKWSAESQILSHQCTFEALAGNVTFLGRLQYTWLMRRAESYKKQGARFPGAWGSTEVYDPEEQAVMVNNYMISMHPSQRKYARFDPKEWVKVTISNVSEEHAKDFFD